jgi:hypothetical protein
MNNLRLPKLDSAVGRGLNTALQGFIGALVLIVTGVIGAVLNTAGCADAVINSLTDSAVQIAGTFGISAGIVSLLLNLALRKEVKNY